MQYKTAILKELSSSNIGPTGPTVKIPGPGLKVNICVGRMHSRGKKAFIKGSFRKVIKRKSSNTL